MENQTVRSFIKNFDEGKYLAESTKVQCEAGWYDWFCDEKSLRNKTKVLGRKVKQLANSPKINLDIMYVFFKNNCPCNGSLYDDFRFCDMKTGDVIYNIVPRSGHTNKAEVWGKENDFNKPLVQGTWKDVKNYFKN